jgi:hypothetical protein
MSDKIKGQHEEFRAIKDEILLWQQFRVTIALGTVAFWGTAFSWLASSDKSIDWQVLSILLMVLIGSASFICFFLGRGNAKMGAYIEVFLENEETGLQWEGSFRNFGRGPREFQLRKEKKIDSLNLNKVFAWLFFSLAVLSILIPPLITSATLKSDLKNIIQYAILFLLSILTFWRIYKLNYDSYPRQDLVNEWERMKKS